MEARELKRLFILRRLSGLSSRAESLQGLHQDSRGFMPDDRPVTMLVSRARQHLSVLSGNLLAELSQCWNRVRRLLAADPQPELMAVR